MATGPVKWFSDEKGVTILSSLPIARRATAARPESRQKGRVSMASKSKKKTTFAKLNREKRFARPAAEAGSAGCAQVGGSDSPGRAERAARRRGRVAQHGPGTYPEVAPSHTVAGDLENALVRHAEAVATVRAFAERAGALRVVLLVDSGDGSAATMLDCGADGALELAEHGRELDRSRRERRWRRRRGRCPSCARRRRPR